AHPSPPGGELAGHLVRDQSSTAIPGQTDGSLGPEGAESLDVARGQILESTDLRMTGAPAVRIDPEDGLVRTQMRKDTLKMEQNPGHVRHEEERAAATLRLELDD